LGPERAQETIRKALAMGAASAVHLKVPDGADLDSRSVAGILADFFRDREVDVISLGKQAQDSDAGLTGSMLAALLDLPFATNAVGLDIEE
jgi:electron transfer flavoprotein beta subunit